MTILVTNDAVGALAGSINDSVLTLALGSGQGALFPAPGAGEFFYVTVIRASDGAKEIMKCTARSTDTLTVVRAQDGTTAKSFASSDRVELRSIRAIHLNYPQLDTENNFLANQTVTGSLTANDLIATDDLTVGDDATIGGDLTVTGTILMSSRKVDAFPAATLMTFQQTSAPTGWTKQVTHNDKALRVVSGTASSGGSTAFSSVFTSRTISQANLPAHTHTFSGTSSTDGSHQHFTFKDGIGGNLDSGLSNVQYPWEGVSDSSRSQNYRVVGQANVADVGLTSANGSHSHTYSGTTSSIGSGTAMDFAVQYVDLIIASKDA